MTIILIIIFIISFLFLYQWKINNRNSPPIPIWPIFGMIPSLVLNAYRIHEFMVDLMLESRGTFVFKGPTFFSLNFLVTSDPINLNYILSRNFNNYEKGDAFREIFENLGNGILATDSDLWRSQRRLIHSLLNNNGFETSLMKMVAKKGVEDLVPILENAVRNGVEVDLKDLIHRVTFDIISSMTMGIDPKTLSVEKPDVEYIIAMTELEEALVYRHIVPESVWKLQRWLQIGEERKMRRSMDVIDRHVNRCILSKRERIRTMQVVNRNDLNASANTNANANADTCTNAGVDASANASMDASANASVDSSANANVGTDASADASVDASADASANVGADASADASANAGRNASANVGADASANAGRDASANTNASANANTCPNAGTDASANSNTSADSSGNTNFGADASANAGADARADASANAGTNPNANTSADANANASVNASADPNANAGRDASANANTNTGANTKYKEEVEENVLGKLVSVDGVSNTMLKDLVFNLIAAGHDTVSTSMTWFFYCVVKYPTVMSKIAEEIDAIFPKQNGAVFHKHILDKKLLDNMIYLHATILEVLRLYPPLPINHKTSIKPDTLPTGHRIEPSTRVLISYYAMGRTKEIWGEDCLEFKPERWISISSKGVESLIHVPSHVFATFNTGPRLCVGKETAFIQLKMVAVMIIRDYNIRLVENRPVSISSSIVLKLENDFKVTITKNHEE